ncbi:MAG: urease accessory protein UreD [Porticoccaceae bacterium]
MNGELPQQQQDSGWLAELELDYAVRRGKTCLVQKKQRGPLTLQRPFYPEGDICHSYLLHPPGGVVGGDKLRISLGAKPGSHCLITTPGATKFYRSKADLSSEQSQKISVADGSVVEWLPQQNIFFPGAQSSLSTQIDVAPTGKFINWEMHCFGRPANQETFHQGKISSRTEVSIGGDLRLVEQLFTDNDSLLQSPSGLRRVAMQGSLIAAPCNQLQRDQLERILHCYLYPDSIGLTLVDEVLVARVLGDQIEPILDIFTQLWSQLRAEWLQKPPCPPRIWNT